ncbi:MAG: hypothetical protein HYY23_00800 [Verrucomicrobia bacterium]|nr:hypothetical protein [Verrucomicrobiota bacterium]
MKVEEVKSLVESQPFRPFAVRLSNGAQYIFSDPRNIGAPEDCRMIFFFGKSEAVRIDTDSIVEIIERQ